MKRLISVISVMLSVLFLCCCANTSAETVTPKTEDVVENTDVRVLTVAVEKGLSENAAAAVDCFAGKIEEISKGRLKVEKLLCGDVLSEIDNGCDIAFGTNAEFARANGDFLIYSSPFYFADYNHLTMTLNSKQFIAATQNSNVNLLKAVPIGAFYDGAYYIVSSREEMYDTLDQYNGKTMNTLGEQPLFEEVLKSLGADARIRNEQYMLSNFGKNRNISAMECEITSLSKITKDEKVDSFHICKSFHRAKINWLMLSEAARSSLSSYEMAVITEATAYTIAKNDGIILKNEEESFEAAEKMGGTVTAINWFEFSVNSEATFKKSNKYGSLWDWFVYEEVRNIAFES